MDVSIDFGQHIEWLALATHGEQVYRGIADFDAVSWEVIGEQYKDGHNPVQNGETVFYKGVRKYGSNAALEIEYDQLQALHAETPDRVATPYLRRLDDEGQVTGYYMEAVDGVQIANYRIPDAYRPVPATQIDPEQVRTQLVDTVTAWHDAGLVHGDLHAYNVLLTRDGDIMIIDPSSRAHLYEQEKMRMKDWRAITTIVDALEQAVEHHAATASNTP